jgi:Tfp pilus assembly protein FimT
MLELFIVIVLLTLAAGFALGYGVREWISRRRHRRFRDTAL